MDYRTKELCVRYGAQTIEQAEKIASGMAWTLDESQPVDDATLSADIDEMRAMLADEEPKGLRHNSQIAMWL